MGAQKSCYGPMEGVTLPCDIFLISYMCVHTCTLRQSEYSRKEMKFICIDHGVMLVRHTHLCLCSALPNVHLIPFYTVRT